MNIGVLGSNGFVGSTVVELLSKEYSVTGINRINYQDCKNIYYDVFINCNGNSKKWWANNHPLEDFEASVISVYNTIFDFQFKKYIYISSFDVMKNNIYGFHKKLAESIIKKYISNYTILRCPSILGKGMKKGVVYDILNGNTVYISSNSQLQFVSKESIVNILQLCIKESLKGIFSIGNYNSIMVDIIGELLDKKINYHETPREEKYNYRVDFPLYSAKDCILTNIK